MLTMTAAPTEAVNDSFLDTKRYYITTPIYYVNGAPHVGTATTTVLADATARYRRLRGDRPYFLTGTDENARKVTEAAEKAGRETLPFVDEVSQRFVETWKLMNCDYDVFFRTTEARHRRIVQEVFTRLKAAGDVYPGVYEGWYSVADETFFRDTDVDETTQTAKESGAKVERVREDTYFFRLSAYGDRLKAHILTHPDFLVPDTRRNEVLAFIEQGLRDINITQNRSGWGIEVPGEPNKIIYVWFDALINYLAESGWPDAPDWDTLWPANVHFMGKEIYTRFHATLWPAMLMALGLPLPQHVVGHGWWLVRDPKTLAFVKGSKSGIQLPLPQETVQLLQERSGAPEAICVDALRYYLCRDIQLQSDAEFSVEMLITRYNSDLANDLGNVLNRVLRAKYFEGTIPQPGGFDDALTAVAAQAVSGYKAALERFDWGAALQAAWTLVGALNKYVAEKEPWTLARNGDTQGVATVVYHALEGARLAAVLVSPVLPSAAAAMGAQLGIANLAAEGTWSEATRWGGLVPGTPIGEPTPLFPRIDTRALGTGTADAAPSPKKGSRTMNTASQEPTFAPVAEPGKTTAASDSALAKPEGGGSSDTVTIDDFARIQLKIAEILTAERIEGAKKLLRLRIRVGEGDDRQLVAGIAESYAPEDLPGRQIVVIANLQPATIRGVQSQGMLLAATDSEGRAILLKPDAPVAPGSKVR
ncbi:MAG: methionine--tRNA ligase [Cytophagales bacterium]|nr:methionine--tRNA ligase [Armatimonadota bacterium]